VAFSACALRNPAASTNWACRYRFAVAGASNECMSTPEELAAVGVRRKAYAEAHGGSDSLNDIEQRGAALDVGLTAASIAAPYAIPAVAKLIKKDPPGKHREPPSKE
jgi:hypothetical protein